MRYISNTAAQQREMLATIGAGSIEDLLSRIPTKARLSHPLNVSAAMAEADLVRHLRRLSSRNANADDFACFLGAGSYDHTVPSPINHLISRGEFFTAYTPYQPEASQGTLRSIFEYQTMMAELTGMDVANASLYDGASSLAEAVLMAHAVTERNTTVLSKGVNPLYRQVVETYVEGPGLRLRSAALGDGATDLDALRKVVNAQTAAVVIQYPNFFGCLEDVKAVGEIAHAAGALLAVDSTAATPVLTRPLALGADLVMHSATKYLNGHSDVIAGTLTAAREDALWERLCAARSSGGAIPGSFEAYLLLRGMRTLFPRVERACRSAQLIAQALAGHPEVLEVLYPGLPAHPGHAVAARQMTGGFGGMLSMRVRGGAEAAIAVASRVEIWKRATSLGGVESLIEHRASVEGAGSPAPADLLRLSVGIEDPDDLIADLEAALL